MEIEFRPAVGQDFEACRRLYLSQMADTIRQLNLDPVAHAAGFLEQWNPAQVRILQVAGKDVGWLQVIDGGEELFLSQIFIEPEFQYRGIGTFAVREVLLEAAAKSLPVALAVVKTNRACRLYTRLGFRTTHEDDVKFYMRLDPNR
jgi:ribosomal protein S18 acetylase RimI-like enzyme